MFKQRSRKLSVPTPVDLEEIRGQGDAAYELFSYEELLKIGQFQHQIGSLIREFRGLDICDVRPVIHAALSTTADFVQLLPASESHHHGEPGGLFLHLIEVATEALRHGNSSTSLIPTRFRGIGHVDEILSGVQLCLVVSALAHDLGKVATDVQVVAIDEDGQRLSGITPYDPHETGWFAQSIVEWLARSALIDGRVKKYRWFYLSGRGSAAHESYQAKGIQALLSRNPKLFAYTRPFSADFFDHRSEHYRNIVLPTIQKADHDSVVADLLIRPQDRKTRVEALFWLFEQFCDAGYLNELPKRHGSYFLSVKQIDEALRANIPGAQDRYLVANLTKDSRPPDPSFFLKQLQGLGLANVREGGDVGASRFDHCEGQPGLILCPELCRLISERARPLPPAENNPVAESAKTAKARLSEDADHHFSSGVILDEDTRNLTNLLLEAHLGECPDRWSIEEGQLIFDKQFLHTAIATARVNRFRLAQSSVPRAADLWSLEKEADVLTGIRCSPAFTKFLLGRQTTNPPGVAKNTNPE